MSSLSQSKGSLYSSRYRGTSGGTPVINHQQQGGNIHEEISVSANYVSPPFACTNGSIPRV